MNTDRFLTRVWDKQDKKMLYPGDKFQHAAYLKNSLIFKSINKDGLICHTEGNSFDDPWRDIIVYVCFGDRFVPMQCFGATDMIKQIIYEDDLIMIPEGLCQVKLGSMFNWHFSEIKDTGVDYMITPKLLKCSNVMGNKWEHPEIMEVKE